MRNKNGFTLIELLAVIVLLGIIMAIAIPNALKLGGSVREQTYQTKIELIEKNAQSYGQSNVANVKRGMSPLTGSEKKYGCTFEYDSDDNISNVTYAEVASESDFNDTKFPCFAVALEDLAKNNSLDYDEKNTCGDSCSEEEKLHYDNIIINPKDNNVINKCVVYVYYKYKRVYSYFDRTACDTVSAYGTYESSHSYLPRRVVNE